LIRDSSPTQLGLRAAPLRAVLGQRRAFLMLVKTYPVPSTKYGETVCCAGIDAETGQWVRVYPVNFRSLDEYRQFSKWQFIEAEWAPAREDQRRESVRVQQETIVAGRTIPPGKGWVERRQWLDSVVDPSLEYLRAQQESGRSLGVIRPASIDAFTIERAGAWDKASTDDLAQLSVQWTDSQTPRGDLEIIPYNFYYSFHCRDSACQGHRMEILDWEIGQAYRNWRHRYGENGWQAQMRRKFGEELPSSDIHLILGTHHRWQNWMIVGVLYPPYPKVVEGQGRLRRHRPGERESMALPFVELEAEQGGR
jgi:hypothetical protein